eukprot:GHVS01105590.1.p2 GENE.GHVS01105590.1~~GHVS01105590.1.p2  ORF type:complete len:107 (-),score=26.05 GHVS01105590.1:251-571(-)
MQRESQLACVCMCVDGGMARNAAFLQLSADVADLSIVRPPDTEVTAVGAAIAAAVGCGLMPAAAVVEAEYRVKDQVSWQPSMDSAARQEKLSQWDRALQTSLNWVS